MAQYSIGIDSYRHKRKRPMLSRWQKFLLGWLHNITPTYKLPKKGKSAVRQN